VTGGRLISMMPEKQWSELDANATYANLALHEKFSDFPKINITASLRSLSAQDNFSRFSQVSKWLILDDQEPI